VGNELANPRYTEEQIHRALVEVAGCSGNTAMAARHLAEDPNSPNIDQKTLWRWSRKQRVDEYDRIRKEALPEITARAAEQHMDLRQQHVELAQDAIVAVKDRLPRMEDKDLVNALGKADIGAGIHAEKAALYAGQPTHRVSRDVSEVLRELEAAGFRGQLPESAPTPKVEVIDVKPVAEETVK